jgi:hypothetical protein
VGRVDDVIMLGNGEKVVPAPIEGALHAHPPLAGVVVFGRAQAGLLLEPAPSHSFDPADTQALAAFRNEVWSAVEDANRVSPAYARIYKEMLLVSSPGKPLPRTGKGTVQKKAAVALYEAEIAAMCVPSFRAPGQRLTHSPATTRSSAQRRARTSSRLRRGTARRSRRGCPRSRRPCSRRTSRLMRTCSRRALTGWSFRPVSTSAAH